MHAARPQRVLVTGGTGLVGRALCGALRAAGSEVVIACRGESAGPQGWPLARWDVGSGRLDTDIEALDAIVHLAGAPIAPKRWTVGRKRVLWESRVTATERLARWLIEKRCSSERPLTFIHASAIGYYGDRGAEALTEDSSPGSGFLADLARGWEAAALPLADHGCRVVHARLGMVLSREGGALRLMLPAFRLGLGGPLGPGDQWVSWITLEDAVAALAALLPGGALHFTGAVNLVAPQSVRQLDLAWALGRQLRRPTFVPTPAFALRVALGELASELLLSSQRVIPERLTRGGFGFTAPTLNVAMERIFPRGG